MTNHVLEFLKTLVGKDLKSSPSPIGGVWLNGTLVSIEKGKACIRYIVRKEMTNPLGTLQGGIFTTMMDDALGVAVYSLGGEDKLYVTINFYVDFLESVHENDAITIEASVLRKGKSLLNVEIKAINDLNKIVAHGKSNLAVRTVDGLVLPKYEGMEKKYPGLTFQNKD